MILLGSQAWLGPRSAERLVPALERDRRAGLPLRHGARPVGRRPPAAGQAPAAGDPARGRSRAARGRARRLPARLRQPHPARRLPGLGQPQPDDLRKNRRPDVGILGDAALAVAGIADALPDQPNRWRAWRERVRARDAARDAEIAELAGQATDGVNPVRLCREIADALPPGTVIIGDGGDIVATASYVLRPDGPLRWLDPGVFGTLGVGAGFALGAAMVHPDAPVWIVFGDGAVGYSITEFDTFVRHGVPVVAIVGNDASWSQIAREQVHLLHDDVGTVLAPTRYDHIAAGFGAVGLHVDHADDLPRRWPRPGQAANPSSSTSGSAEPTSARARSRCDRYDSHGSTGRPRAGAEQHTQHPESSLAGVSPVRVAGIRAAVPRDLGGHQNREHGGRSRATSYRPQSASARDNRRTPRPTGARCGREATPPLRVWP